MNIATIRATFATATASVGFNTWDYQPDDPQDLPAAVVGGITEYERLNRKVTRIQLICTLYVSSADAADATRRLDLALSTGVAGSLVDALSDVVGAAVVSAGPYRSVLMPDGSTALSVPITIEVTST